MNVLYNLILVVWWFRIIANVATFIQLWFIKEYRVDRMLVHLKTDEGKRIWRMPFRRPRISPKTIVLFLGSVVTLGAIYGSSSLYPLLRLFIIDCITFPVVSLCVLIANVPTYIYHEILIARAGQTLRRHRPMTVIGITGSFGKTSVKDYLATILSSKFKVLKTEASKNSPIGIAEVILRKLTPEHEVFIVEMGAYKIGEIAEMVAMVKPHIGIVTAINAQHQDLFGSLENTMKAKYELIAGLEGKRIAIMNVGDVRVRTMAKWAKRDGCDVWSGRFSATGVRAGFQGLEFTCNFGKEKARVKASVIGVHQVSNALAAIAGAVAAGMNFRDAVKAAEFIQPSPKSLGVIPGINGSMYINDTFNNSPDSAKAALDVLSWAKGKKYLIFQPMIELGQYADASHREVGYAAGKMCDHIILTNRNFFDAFMEGAKRAGAGDNVHVFSPVKAGEFIRSRIGRGDTVLFKGKETERVLRSLI